MFEKKTIYELNTTQTVFSGWFVIKIYGKTLLYRRELVERGRESMTTRYKIDFRSLRPATISIFRRSWRDQLQRQTACAFEACLCFFSSHPSSEASTDEIGENKHSELPEMINLMKNMRRSLFNRTYQIGNVIVPEHVSRWWWEQ